MLPGNFSPRQRGRGWIRSSYGHAPAGRGTTGPVEAIEEYVGLLSAGEAEAASDLVDPADSDASVTAAGDGSGPDAVPEEPF